MERGVILSSDGIFDVERALLDAGPRALSPPPSPTDLGTRILSALELETPNRFLSSFWLLSSSCMTEMAYTPGATFSNELWVVAPRIVTRRSTVPAVLSGKPEPDL